MIKRTNKIILAGMFLILTLLGALCVYISVKNTPVKKEELPLRFSIDDNTGQVMISVYEANDDNVLVFLPSYAKMGNVKLHTEEKLYIDGKNIEDGTPCENYEENKVYDLKINETENRRIQFIKSANIATMYINTISGSMDKVYEDIDHEEMVDVKLVDTNGTVANENRRAKIKGRGNSTWGGDNKKNPYNLSLSKEDTLLGMRANTKWNLLANVADHTDLRNKIVYDFARSVGVPSPECEFVDLYLNGEYNGLYLLTENIDCNILNIPDNGSNYLFQRDIHVNNGETAFTTYTHQPIKVKCPKINNKNRLDKLKSHVQSMENAILSDDGIDAVTGKRWTDFVDVDSWAKKYLIEEIFASQDAGINSQYFYWQSDSDSKIYAGPAWDYDLSIGNSVTMSNPRFFAALRPNVNKEHNTYFYSGLYSKNEFYERTIELYKNHFIPKLEDVYGSEIDRVAADIMTAHRMSELRWGQKAGDESFISNIDEMKDYLRRHIEFLNSAWIDNVKYNTVSFDIDINDNDIWFGYKYYTVENGKRYKDFPSAGELGISNEIEWYNKDTGEMYDPNEPITQDITLCSKIILEKEQNNDNDIDLQVKIRSILKQITIITLFLFFVVIFVVMVIIDKNNTKSNDLSE